MQAELGRSSMIISAGRELTSEEFSQFQDDVGFVYNIIALANHGDPSMRNIILLQTGSETITPENLHLMLNDQLQIKFQAEQGSSSMVVLEGETETIKQLQIALREIGY